MAEIIDPTVGVDPNAVALVNAAPVSNVAPVVVDKTPSQEYDDAVDSRSPQKAMQVAASNVGTPVAFAAVKAADLMLKGEQAFKDMSDPIDKAGGLGTPKGNIAASEKAKEYFTQEDPNIRNAFVYLLTGNKAMAQAMLTGGTVTKSIVPDIDGKLIKVAKNQLGDIVDVEDSLGNKLTREEYDKRAVGRQRYEDTLSFKNQSEQQTANIAALKESQTVNNAFAAAAPEMESKYGQIYDDLASIRQLNNGLGAKEYANVLKYASSSLGTADSLSKGTVAFDQFTKNLEANVGKEVSKKDIMALGLDAGATWKYTKEGVVNEKSGRSISTSELKNKQSSENKNNELTSNFQQIRKDLIASKKFGQLETEDQNRLLRVLENSQQLGQKQLELRAAHKAAPSFLISPSSIEIEDQYGLGQAKAIQGIFNAKALQLYSQYEKKALAQSGGIAPDPKALEAGFARTKEYKELIAEAKKRSDLVMGEPVRDAGAPVDFSKSEPSGPKAPPKTTPKAKETEGKAPPSVPNGVPKGSVKSDRVTPDGKALWKAPDGKLHTED